MVSHEGDVRLRFGILGPLEVWQDDRRIRLGGPLQERVLGTLLLEANRVVPISRLIEAAWDENPPATAQHQVRKIVAELRRRLPGGPELLLTDGAGYRIRIDEEQLDLSLFATRLARAREAVGLGLLGNAAEQLSESLGLWRGPVLGGKSGPVLDAAAAVYEERRLAAAEQLLDFRLAKGEAAEAIGDLRAMIAEHPLRESLRARLMLALYHRGRQAEALEEFAAARRLLAEELGVDPGPELTRMYEGILRNDPELAPPERTRQQDRPTASWAPAAARTCTLPYDLPDFTGRRPELDVLLGIGGAEGRTMRLVAIDGMGGSGKTALAVHAAHRMASRFPDGQLYVDLRGFSPGGPLDPGTALDLLLRMLEVPGGRIPEDTASRIALWRVVTANRRLLLVLDNASDAAQVRPLLPVSAGALVLVTSRIRMTDLDGASTVSTARMTQADCRALLSRGIGEERVDAEPEAVSALIELCGHLPLALRIAAARLRARPRWSVQDLVTRLGAEESKLGELESGDRSVSATIALSYQALTEAHRLLLRRLGAHPGRDFDIHAVAVLAGIPVPQADRLLDGLLDAHLLEQKSAERYAFHDLVRSYVHGLVGGAEFAEEQQAAWRRLLDDYLATSRAAADLLLPGRREIPLGLPEAPRPRPAPRDAEESLRWFDTERLNLVGAVRLAVQHGMDRQAALLARDLGNYLQQRGFLGDLLEIEEAAVAASRRIGDHALERSSLIALAAPRWHVGQPREAMELLNQALHTAVLTGDQQDEAAILSRIGTQYSALGNYTEGLRHKERALELHRALGDRRGEAWALVGISSAQVGLGAYGPALETARLSLTLHQELGDGDGEIMARVNAANAENGRGHHASALEYLWDALRVAERMSAFDGLALVHTRLCDTYVRLGRFEEALSAGAEALEQARAVQRPAVIAIAENILGAAHLLLGEPGAAQEHHRNALQAAEESETRHEAARARAGLGDALHALGRSPEAWEHWEAALRHFDAMGVPEAAEVAAKMARARRGGEEAVAEPVRPAPKESPSCSRAADRGR